MSNWKKESRPWLVLIALGLIFSWGCQDPATLPTAQPVSIKSQSPEDATELLRLLSGTRTWHSPWTMEFATHLDQPEALTSTCRTFWKATAENQTRMIWPAEALTQEAQLVAALESEETGLVTEPEAAPETETVDQVGKTAGTSEEVVPSQETAEVELSESLADEAAVAEAVAKVIQSENEDNDPSTPATATQEVAQDLHETTTAAIRELTERTHGLEIENDLLRRDRLRLMKTLSKLSMRIEKLEEKTSSHE